MPRVIITAEARQDLIKRRRWLAEKNPTAAIEAAKAIKSALRRLAECPEIGTPYSSVIGLRRLVVPFGQRGYVIRYHFRQGDGLLYVLTIRHQLEDD